MKYLLTIATLLFSFSVAKAQPKEIKNCDLAYVTKSSLSEFRAHGTPISSLSRSINDVLKSSFEFVNAIDKYTLGLASTLTLGAFLNTNASLEDIKPHQWNKIILSGSIIYREPPLTIIPIRGAKIKISHAKNSEIINSGSDGQFDVPFYKIIPYTRFRLFPGPRIERRERLVKTIDPPIEVEIISNVCHAKMKLTDLPIDPMTFVLSPRENAP